MSFVLNGRGIVALLGVFLAFFSIVLIVPLIVGLYYDEPSVIVFSFVMVFCILCGSLMYFPFAGYIRKLKLRDGFVVTTLLWVLLSCVAALIFHYILDIPLVDALFEGFSALTTTGSTILVGLDEMPRGVLIYRQILQWIGGMGLIVLAVAILPLLDVGGMQLYRIETPGPVKDNRLAPRIQTTAITLWGIYVALTVLCGLAYKVAGMGWFDAIAHAFSTVAIGGFSTHDSNMGYFDSPAIEGVAIVFMILSGGNFALHFFAWRYKSVLHYFRDEEFLFYISIIVFAILILTVSLYSTDQILSVGESFRIAVFQGASYVTTTGFTTVSTPSMAALPQLLLVAVPFIGGCAGSVGGGTKVVRVLLLLRQGYREINRLIHPSGIYHVKLNGRELDSSIRDAIWGFITFYGLSYVVLVLIVGGSGVDFHTAASAVAACLNNLGPGQGDVYANYASLSDFTKLVLAFAMLLGRLEIMTIFVLFAPSFWKS